MLSSVPMHSTVIYKKRAVKSRTWKILFSAWLLVAIIPTVLDHSSHTYYSKFIVYGAVYGLPLAIWALALWSINFYGTVTITSQKFRVGRQEVLFSDIKSMSLTGENTDFMSRLIKSTQEIDLPIKFLNAEAMGKPPIFGGAWGTPLAMDSFVMELKDGKQYTVPLPHGCRQEIAQAIARCASNRS